MTENIPHPNEHAQHSADGLDLLNTLEERVAAFREALFAHPDAVEWLEHTPGLGFEIPWSVVCCSGPDGERLTGLVVAGVFADGQWVLDAPFVLFTGTASEPGAFVAIDGAHRHISPQGSLPGTGPRRPDQITLLTELAAASAAWAANPALQAQWCAFATAHGCESIPDTFVEFRFQGACYRGLILDGTLDSDGLWDMGRMITLLLPSGRAVCLLADQADTVVMLTRGQYADIKRVG